MAEPHTTHTATGSETHEHGAIHMPDPSIFPLVLAVGMTFIPLGLLLGPVVLVIGLIVFAIGLGGWLTQDTKTHLKARQQKH